MSEQRQTRVSVLLLWRSRRPIRERHRAATAHHRRNNVVESLVFLRRIIELELGTEAQVVVMDRFDSANESFPRQVLPRSLEAFHHHHGVHESLEADKIGLL